MNWLPPTPRESEGMGVLCRCLACCCPPGQGHRSKAYREWADRMEAAERAEDGRGSGTSPGSD